MAEKSSKKLKMTSNGAKNDQEGHVIIFEKNVFLVKKLFSTSSALQFHVTNRATGTDYTVEYHV
jgi:hypothetical protein